MPSCSHLIGLLDAHEAGSSRRPAVLILLLVRVIRLGQCPVRKQVSSRFGSHWNRRPQDCCKWDGDTLMLPCWHAPESSLDVLLRRFWRHVQECVERKRIPTCRVCHAAVAEAAQLGPRTQLLSEFQSNMQPRCNMLDQGRQRFRHRFALQSQIARATMTYLHPHAEAEQGISRYADGSSVSQ